MRKEASSWALGLGMGLIAAALAWSRAFRVAAHRRRVVADLGGRIIALEESVSRAEEESAAQKRLADQRRAELSDALAREERLRAEFTALQRREAEATAHVRSEEQLALFERLAGLLVQLPTVKHAVAAGGEVGAGDVLALLDPLHQVLADIGFESIGEPGAATTFDPRLHQSVDGNALQVGQPVCVQFVGYRRDAHILRRAQVTAM